MATYMRGDVWELLLVDLIISVDNMIEAVFPVHGHKR